VPALNANFTSTERAGFDLSKSIESPIPPRIFTFVNTSNAPRPTPTDTASVTSVWTYKRIADAKGNAVAGTETRFATRYTPGELTLRESGQYEIKLRINNKAGNTDCAPSEKIIVVNVPDFQTPNVFTPNRDGKNDTFVLTTEQVGSKVQIFNRWGRMVKEYANYQNNWDGGEQPAGVYYYLLTDRNGKTSKGWVELAR
jgi:gliding motility-associated-like protein